MLLLPIRFNILIFVQLISVNRFKLLIVKLILEKINFLSLKASICHNLPKVIVNIRINVIEVDLVLAFFNSLKLTLPLIFLID